MCAKARGSMKTKDIATIRIGFLRTVKGIQRIVDDFDVAAILTDFNPQLPQWVIDRLPEKDRLMVRNMSQSLRDRLEARLLGTDEVQVASADTDEAQSASGGEKCLSSQEVAQIGSRG